MFRTENDVAGSAVISQLSAGRKNRLWLEVDGMQQSAVFDQEQPEQLWIGTEAGAQVLVRDPNHGSAEQRRLSTPAGRSCRRATRSASRATSPTPTPRWTPPRGAAKVPDGLPTFADGLARQQICDAMLRSASSGEWVSVGSQMTDTYIRALEDEGLGLPEIGGKAQSLARLAAAGLPVPMDFISPRLRTTLRGRTSSSGSHRGDLIGQTLRRPMMRRVPSPRCSPIARFRVRSPLPCWRPTAAGFAAGGGALVCDR